MKAAPTVRKCTCVDGVTESRDVNSHVNGTPQADNSNLLLKSTT